MSNLSIIGNMVFSGEIVCLTGMHIGGNKDKIEIGGIDNPVIKHPTTNYPYIPGSSIKGKARMMLEILSGKIEVKGDRKKDGNTHNCNEINCPVCRLFGTSAEKSQAGPSRLIFRDAYPTDDTIEMWNTMESDLPYTEHKWENTINRLTSSANPRDMERVVKDSKFHFEIVFCMFDGFGTERNDAQPDSDYLKNFISSLKLIQETALGGSGSRGYGKVEFVINDIKFLSKEYYLKDEKPKSSSTISFPLKLNDITDKEIEEIKKLTL